ncbi:MAG: hypothetical protein Q8P98_11240 [Candidatus Rokubacteria bacterium]|nr:hypothetical protein [Candidatus Rokubacteria bacterium]
MMNVSVIISLIIGSIALIGFIYNIGFTWGNTKREVAAIKKTTNDLCDMVTKLNNQVTRLDTQMSPFWNIVETKLADMLHSSHTPTYDALLLKLKNNISYSELIELEKLVSNDLDESVKLDNTTRALLSSLVKSRVLYKINAIDMNKKILC